LDEQSSVHPATGELFAACFVLLSQRESAIQAVLDSFHAVVSFFLFLGYIYVLQCMFIILI
jgi:hypothetical protein